MFTEAYTTVREATYFLLGRSAGESVSCSTAFMIAPGVVATVAHVLYKNEGEHASFQERIRVMRDPEIGGGQTMEAATVIAVDAEYDIGLLRLENPRTDATVSLTTDIPRPGTPAGAVGYPLVNPSEIVAQKAIPLLRFQAGHMSAIYAKIDSGRQFTYCETDVPMFKGSSGCPGFLVSGKVFGMHVAEWHDRGIEDLPGQRAFSMWVPASEIISFAEKNKIEIPKSS